MFSKSTINNNALADCSLKFQHYITENIAEKFSFKHYKKDQNEKKGVLKVFLGTVANQKTFQWNKWRQWKSTNLGVLKQPQHNVTHVIKLLCFMQPVQGVITHKAIFSLKRFVQVAITKNIHQWMDVWFLWFHNKLRQLNMEAREVKSPKYFCIMLHSKTEKMKNIITMQYSSSQEE